MGNQKKSGNEHSPSDEQNDETVVLSSTQLKPDKVERPDVIQDHTVTIASGVDLTDTHSVSSPHENTPIPEEIVFAKKSVSPGGATESMNIHTKKSMPSIPFKMARTVENLGKTFVGEVSMHSGVFVLIFIISVVVIILFKLPLMDHFELRAYDLRVSKYQNVKISPDLVLVEIQDECIREFGQWPWPRTMHAAFLNILYDVYRPLLVGFDILFLDPSRIAQPAEVAQESGTKDKLIDLSFSKAISSSGNIFLPGVMDKSSQETLPVFTKPLDMFLKNSLGYGHINYNVDPDGTVRRVPLVIKTAEGWIPHMAFTMVLNYLGVAMKDLDIIPGEKIEFTEVNGEINSIPIDESGQMLLLYPGKWGEKFRHVAYRDIRQAKAAANFEHIEYRVAPEVLKDKILITGMGATTGSVDYKPTPVQSEYPLMGVHAVIMNQIINKSYIHIVSPLWNLGFCFLLAMLIGFFAMNYSPFRGLTLTLLTLGMVICVSFIFLLYCDLWIELVRPVITISLTYIILGTYSHVKFKDHVDLKLTFEQKLNMADARLPQFRPNLKIGTYSQIRELGRGGMAIVYEGTGKDHKKYAIKVINPEMLSKEGFKFRFKREIMTMKKVVHPNVIRVYDSGTYQGVLYYAMELFPAGDLGEHMSRLSKVRDYEWMKTFLLQLLDGLGAIHDAGLIHRDIKPANIMMNDQSEIKLADFGLAKSADEGQLLTTVGQVLGTPAYLSPEVCMGEEPDFSADIYAMGIVFYEILTGYRPFQECATMAVLMQSKLRNPIVPVIQKNSEIPGKLANIVDKMVAKNKHERYATTQEVRQDLIQFNEFPKP